MYNKLLGNIPLFLLTSTYMACLSPHLCPTITLLIIYLCFWQSKLKPSFCVILPSFSPLTWTHGIMTVGTEGDDVSVFMSFGVPSFQFPLVFHPSLLTLFGSWIEGNQHDKINDLHKGFNFDSLKLTLVLLRKILEQRGDFQCSLPVRWV